MNSGGRRYARVIGGGNRYWHGGSALDNEHKAVAYLYSLNPTLIDNYYQCYAEYDEDDDDSTIITSNLKENKSEKLGGVTQEIWSKHLKTLDKNSGDQGVTYAT